jgi:hypothetical protein
LVTLQTDGQLRRIGLTKAELFALGFRLLVDPVSPVLIFHKVLKQCYEAIARGESASLFDPEGLRTEQEALHQTIGLDEMLAIERATVEK